MWFVLILVSRQSFNKWEAKPKPIAIVRASFPGLFWASYRYDLLGILIGLSRLSKCACVWFVLILSKFLSHRSVFKWLSKIITRLRLLRLVIDLKVSRQSFNKWEAKPKPIAIVRASFPGLFWASYRYDLLGILIGLSRLSGNVVIGRINNFGIGFTSFIW